VIRRRKGLRLGELTSKQKGEIREQVWRRDKGRCIDCGRGVILERGFWSSMHLMHLKSKGSGGTWELSNLATGCISCHMIGRHNPKPCPPKPKVEEANGR
jgi:5-methylcytosine-specific restriction endonuclease McrA